MNENAMFLIIEEKEEEEKEDKNPHFIYIKDEKNIMCIINSENLL